MQNKTIGLCTNYLVYMDKYGTERKYLYIYVLVPLCLLLIDLLVFIRFMLTFSGQSKGPSCQKKIVYDLVVAMFVRVSLSHTLFCVGELVHASLVPRTGVSVSRPRVEP